MITNNRYKSQRIINMNEALGGLERIRQKQQAQTSSDDRTQEEKEEYLRKLEIQGARSIGKLEAVLPEFIANIEECFPDCKSMKEYTAVMSTDNSYYVTEDAHVILHVNINNDNINNLLELISKKKVNVDAIIGDIDIEDNREFKGFCNNFPNTIYGNLKLRNIPNMETLENVPMDIKGNDIRIRNLGIDMDDEINNYYKRINYIRKNKPLGISVFRSKQSKSFSESAAQPKFHVLLESSFEYEFKDIIRTVSKGKKNKF